MLAADGRWLFQFALLSRYCCRLLLQLFQEVWRLEIFRDRIIHSRNDFVNRFLPRLFGVLPALNRAEELSQCLFYNISEILGHLQEYEWNGNQGWKKKGNKINIFMSILGTRWYAQSTTVQNDSFDKNSPRYDYSDCNAGWEHDIFRCRCSHECRPRSSFLRLLLGEHTSPFEYNRIPCVIQKRTQKMKNCIVIVSVAVLLNNCSYFYSLKI